MNLNMILKIFKQNYQHLMISISETLKSTSMKNLMICSQKINEVFQVKRNSKTKKSKKMICDDFSTSARNVDLNSTTANFQMMTMKNNEIRTKTDRFERCEEKLIQSFQLFFVLMMKFDVIQKRLIRCDLNVWNWSRNGRRLHQKLLKMIQFLDVSSRLQKYSER